MKTARRNRGFTLTEVVVVFLIIVLIIVGIYGFLIMTVCKGNFWFSDASVLRELQTDHPSVVQVLKTERNVYADSVITVKNSDGSMGTYCLESSIFWNYTFSDCKK